MTDKRRTAECLKSELMGLCEINKSNGCWEWRRYINPGGYGMHRRLGQKLAHRVSYVLFKSPIPKGLEVCHVCDNRKCINPDHLFVGTRKDNMQDCVKKGRLKVNRVYGSRNGMSKNPDILSGERNGMAKLNRWKVYEIRSLFKTGKYTKKRLSDAYGVHAHTIGEIIREEIWKP